MPLPVLTTAEDVRSLVNYLKTKPTGATIAEAKAAIKGSVLDGRKFTAYSLWGFVTKEGERIKLTQRGWDFARKPESEQDIYRRVIDSISPYKSVLEWAFHQKMDSISNVDVAAHWHEHHKEALSTDSEETIKNNAVCFFHVAQAAGLGTLMIGRRGQPTRLDIDREQLTKFIEAGPSAPPWTGASDEALAKSEAVTDAETFSAENLNHVPSSPAPAPTSAAPGKRTTNVRCFISHGATWT